MAETKRYPLRNDRSRTGKEKIQEITERLEQGVKELFTSEKYAAWLKTMSAFHHYSFNNTLLIALQAPAATQVASYQTWKKLHRQVRKGEKGIKILVPAPVKVKHEEQKLDPITSKPLLDPDGRPLTETKELVIQHFKIGHVFAYEQTEGEPLPELGPDELTGSVPNYESLKKVIMEISPVPVRFDSIEGGAKGYFSHIQKEIVIKDGMSELQTVKTMIHELGHALCHDRDHAGEEGFQKDRQTKEVEADSISYTVCAMLKLDVSDYAFPYIAGWSSSKELKELRSSMDLIRETSGRILDSIVEKLREKEIRETGISLKESMAEGKRQSIKVLLTEPMRENDRMDVLQKGGEVCR